MTIHLDHTIVPSKTQVKSAKLLADLLGVAWAESEPKTPFSPVYVNDGLTLDFIDSNEAFPVYHFCFRVSPEEFDVILGRIKGAGIPFRSQVRGPTDHKIDPTYGNIYWNEPDGHMWELLTVSYARPKG